MKIQWFLESDSGEKVGPVGTGEARSFATSYPESFA